MSIKEIDFIEVYRIITYETFEGSKEEKTKNFLDSFKNQNINRFVDMVIQYDLNPNLCNVDSTSNFRELTYNAVLEDFSNRNFTITIKDNKTLIKLK
jgi:hypothetical protein